MMQDTTVEENPSTKRVTTIKVVRTHPRRDVGKAATVLNKKKKREGKSG